MRTFLLSSLLAAFVLIAPNPVSAKASAQEIEAKYNVTLSGFRMGKLRLRGAVTPSAYTLRGQGEITGIAGVLVEFKGNANSSGQLLSSGPRPKSHDILYNTARKDIITKMGFSGTSVSRLAVEPPVKQRGTRVAVTAAHKKGVVDPISALLVKVAGSKNDADPKVCDRTLRIFDGRERYDIVLSYSSATTGKVKGFEGTVIKCNARYKPISGHRTDNDMVNDMASRSDIAAYFARVPGSDLFMFYRATLPSSFGVVDIKPDYLRLSASAQANK